MWIGICMIFKDILSALGILSSKKGVTTGNGERCRVYDGVLYGEILRPWRNIE